MPAKLSDAEFLGRVDRLFNGTVAVESEYLGKARIVNVSCTVCSRRWRPYAGNLLAGTAGCLDCGNRRRMVSEATTLADIAAALGARVRVLGPHQGNGSPLPVECTACGHQWAPIARFLRLGHGCPRCAGKLLTHEEVVARVHERFGGTITLLGQFTTVSNRIEARCEGCSHVWRPTAAQLLRGAGCGHCNRKGYSPQLPAWLYCFAFNGPEGEPLYKVGITNRDPRDRYEGQERARLRPIWRRWYETGVAARDAERRLLRQHAGMRYRGPTGFGFTDAEVLLVRPAL